MSDGRRIPLKEVQVGDFVVTHKGRCREVVGKAEQGELDCINIKTVFGRSVTAALDHPFLTPDGYVLAGELKVGDTLAVVPNVAIPDSSDRSIEEFRIAGYMVGDGCAGRVGKGISFRFCFTNMDEAVLDDFSDCIHSLGLLAENKGRKKMPNGQRNRASTIVVKAPKVKGQWRKAQDWLRDSGLAGFTGRDKHVPEWVFKGSPEKIAAFIGAYFACDGTVSMRGTSRSGKKRPDRHVSIASISPNLLNGVQHLLLRLGINARVETYNVKNARQADPSADYLVHRLCFVAQDDATLFARLVPVVGPKNDSDKLPYLAQRNLSRFPAELFSDTISEIKSVGKKSCLCIEVKEDHTYTASDLVVHNSRIVSVYWPCWEWLDKPWLRFLCLSYAGSLATDHNQDRQALIESDWYQSISGGLALSNRKNRMTEFENSKRGVMRARGLDGGVTGVGGDRIIVDDANNPEKVESDAVRLATESKFRSYTVTRRDSPKDTAIINIQQRTHEQDISGWIQQNDPGYVQLILPTIADRREVITFPRSGKQIIREPGDLLHPERFGMDQVDEAKLTMGSYMFAGRHLQKPSPAEGGLFKLRDWVLYAEEPRGISQTILSVDAAFKGTERSDYVVIGAIAQRRTGKTIEVEVKGKKRSRPEFEYFVPYRWRNQTGISGTERAIKEMAQRFPQAVTKLIEDKANGPAIIERLAGQISGVKAYNPGRDNKLSRASAVQPIHERHGILLPIADWAKAELKEMGRDRITVGEWWDLHPPPHTSNAEHVPVADWAKEFIDEAAVFPVGANDDQVDMLVQGINWMESKAPVSAAAKRPVGTKVINPWR